MYTRDVWCGRGEACTEPRFTSRKRRGKLCSLSPGDWAERKAISSAQPLSPPLKVRRLRAELSAFVKAMHSGRAGARFPASLLYAKSWTGTPASDALCRCLAPPHQHGYPHRLPSGRLACRDLPGRPEGRTTGLPRCDGCTQLRGSKGRRRKGPRRIPSGLPGHRGRSANREAGRALYRHPSSISHGTSLADAIIASSAESCRAVLVPLNRRHFPMVRGIKVPYSPD